MQLAYWDGITGLTSAQSLLNTTLSRPWNVDVRLQNPRKRVQPVLHTVESYRCVGEAFRGVKSSILQP